MNWYYVYRHIRLDTNTVFYVGKGHGNRAYRKNDRNKYWGRITKAFEYKIELIETDLTEEEAYNREIYWIKHYKELKQCEANFQLGGGSSSQGIKHPCADCGCKLKNIYSTRCLECQKLYRQTDEGKNKHSEAQKRRFKDPNQRAQQARRVGVSPANKGIKTGKPSWQTGRPLSEETKQKIRDTKKKNRENKDATNFNA